MLELKSICKNFGGVRALQNVSCAIDKGNITGIIGPNGAGKTTLFNIVTGLYTASSGEVFFEGENITGYAPERLAKLGLIRTFQNVELFNRMTVLENVMVGYHSRTRSGMISCLLKFPRHLREEKAIRKQALEKLKFAGLEEMADLEAGSLPFGQGRLLEIARALAAEPGLILMDEPAAGLNSRETADLADLIRKINQLNITIVLVEHDMDLIMEVCDNILVLNLGQKLAEGTPRQIQENRDVVKAYLGDG